MTRKSDDATAVDAARLSDTLLRREWLVTNGLGGYGSSSVAGANTRRYHGLLVAALTPPTGRAVLLSKFDETVAVEASSGAGAREFALSTNLYPGLMHPEGYRAIQSWSCDPAPTWRFAPALDVVIEKRVWMAHGHNATYVSYTLINSPNDAARLCLTPLLAWKDYHSEMRAWGDPPPATWNGPGTPSTLTVMLPGIAWLHPGPFALTVAIREDDGSPMPDALFTQRPDWYYRFQHPRERERGLDCEEDLFTPGVLTIPLRKGRTVTIVASAGPGVPDAPRIAWEALRRRQADLLDKASPTDDFSRELTLAADQFIVQAPGGRSTVIAGYPWFNDWGRDTMIALPGLCLATGRPEIARDILLSFARFVDRGMLPNRFPDQGETPDYNTVDATLWYFAAVYRYCAATGDCDLIRTDLWSVLQGIVDWHIRGTRFNIHVDPADGMLHAGETGAQLTWMDAKIGDWVVTPRTGKPVEINALWINALRSMAYLARRIEADADARAYDEHAERATASFLARFPRPDGSGLYDVLDTPPSGAPDGAIRPNQIFAVSLPFAPVEAGTALARAVVAEVDTALRTAYGLRTLSPRDPAYRPRYEGDSWQRDSAYHQGTVWPWLLGAFVEALYRVRGDREEAMHAFDPLRAQGIDYGVGSIAEVFDGDPPQRAGGCIAQAWSVAETLRVWKQLQGR